MAMQTGKLHKFMKEQAAISIPTKKEGIITFIFNVLCRIKAVEERIIRIAEMKNGITIT
tara:strand:+ start:459 stop:635 length:177 start_codon:yes stop_codon:yes gene_type:complete